MWHDEVGAALRRRYDRNGWSARLYQNDWALLRRTCGGRHPAEVSTVDLEEIILAVGTHDGRINYIHRFRSIFRTLRDLAIVPAEHRPDEGLPRLKKSRAVPRPISREQAQHLMTHAREPMREWFILACLAGLRAMEVSAVEGRWLEVAADGPSLRVYGKGRTEMVIPAHPLVAEVIEGHRTFGRLYTANPTQVSRYGSQEMRRLGVAATFHACRHFFGTELMAVTSDLLLVSEMMRHASLQSTRGYVQLQQGRKRSALTAMLEVGQGGAGHALAL